MPDRKTQVVTLFASATITQTTSGTAVSTGPASTQPILPGSSAFNSDMRVFMETPTTTGTSPTLDLTIEGRVDSSSQWTTLTPSAAWTQVTSTTTTGTQARTYAAPLPPEIRPKLTVGGTTPTYVVQVKAVLSTHQ